ncbi:MAG: hypothetical protein ACRC4W_06785 [Treponemataceae bacterium]
MFLEVLKKLMPKNSLFRLSNENKLYLFLKSFSALPDKTKESIDLLFLDIFPKTTRFINEWLNAFGFYLNEEEEVKSKEILSLLWTIQGGYTAEFLQKVLRIFDKKINVIENIPTRNPLDSYASYYCVCGQENFYCGGQYAACGYRVGSDEGVADYYCVCGQENFYCGGQYAVCGYNEIEDTVKPAILENNISSIGGFPNSSDYWETSFYVCGEIQRSDRGYILYIDFVNVNKKWQRLVEYFILKIKPAHTRAVVYIKWI